MVDHATPNLPSRDFDATEAFYAALGFVRRWRDGGWMILARGSVSLEFFRYPDLDPLTSSFGCCLRLDHLDAFMGQVGAAGIPDARHGIPRFHPSALDGPSGLTIAYLVDPDGTLLRLVQN